MAQGDWPAPPRAWAMALLLAAYAAGAYHAWQAIAVPRHALPDANHLQQLAAALPPPAASAAAVAARGLCASPGPALQLTLLLAEPNNQAAVDLAALADGLLQPTLSQLAGAATISSSTALLPPALPHTELQWVEQRQAYVLSGEAVETWAQQLQRKAWEVGGSMQQEQAGQVLIYVPSHTQQPLLLEPVAGGSEASSSLELSDGSLLLIANQSQASSSSSSGRGLEGELAQRILSWLLQPVANAVSPDSSSGAAARNATVSQLQRGLAGACAAGAAAAVRQATAAAAAAHEQPVTAGMAAAAAEAEQLLQLVAGAGSARQTEAAQLAAAVRAWTLAQQLLRDPAGGARPAFPPEHAMAVLLPLSLPVTLVLAQAVGRQVSAWKQQRQGQGQEPKGQQHEGQQPIEEEGAVVPGSNLD